MTQVLRGVVFDMDGVIVDSHPAHRSAWKEFLRALGKEVPDGELDFIMDGRKREEILTHFLGPLEPAELQAYGRVKNDLFWQAASEVTPILGVFQFVQSLHAEGIPMAVATSASSGRTQSTLKCMGLLNRFSAVVTGDDVPKGKPDPGIYQLACQRIHCPPHAAVAFEDAASGVRAAKSAGVKCVAIAADARRDLLLAAGADAVLPDFVDITPQSFRSLFGINRSSLPLMQNASASSKAE